MAAERCHFSPRRYPIKGLNVDGRSYTAIVLAARRGGADPLTAAAAGGHKCLIDILGRTMIAWVIDTLLHAPMVGKILISIEDSALLEGIPEIATGLTQGRVEIIPSGPNLYLSVKRALGPRDCNYPAIFTTADNPLLTVDMLNHFCRAVERRGSDAAIAIARADVIRGKYPDGKRLFYRFQDDAYSNCNLYALTSKRAIHAAKIFEGGGQFRKKTRRMLSAFGVVNLIIYKLRALSLEGFGQRLSRAFGITLDFVEMPFADAPIDVDDERALSVVRAIMAARADAT